MTKINFLGGAEKKPLRGVWEYGGVAKVSRDFFHDLTGNMTDICQEIKDFLGPDSSSDQRAIAYISVTTPTWKQGGEA
ncbi:MAG: hypothetical protein V3V49_05605, partial [Candidatus Krumholzibacteria bacterium]